MYVFCPADGRKQNEAKSMTCNEYLTNKLWHWLDAAISFLIQYHIYFLNNSKIIYISILLPREKEKIFFYFYLLSLIRNRGNTAIGS